MKPKVYLETTIVSYLAARPSRNLIVAAHQQITHDWWDGQRGEFDLFVSQLVVDEASKGNPEVAKRRRELLATLPVLDVTDEAAALARTFTGRRAVPAQEPEDSLHIALAAVHGMDLLLTWNCAHIANARMHLRLYEACLYEGYELPRICTPTELTGEGYDVER